MVARWAFILVVVTDVGFLVWGIVATLDGAAQGHLGAQMYPIGALVVIFALGVASGTLPDRALRLFIAAVRVILTFLVAGIFGQVAVNLLPTSVVLLALAFVGLLPQAGRPRG